MVSKALLLLTAAATAQAATCVITTTSILYGFAGTGTGTTASGTATGTGTTTGASATGTVAPTTCDNIVNGLCVLSNFAPRAGLVVKRATVIGTFTDTTGINQCIQNHCATNSACKSAGFDSTTNTCYLYSEAIQNTDLVQQQGFSVAIVPPPGFTVRTTAGYNPSGTTSSSFSATNIASSSEPTTSNEPTTSEEPTSTEESSSAAPTSAPSTTDAGTSTSAPATTSAPTTSSTRSSSSSSSTHTTAFVFFAMDDDEELEDLEY